MTSKLSIREDKNRVRPFPYIMRVDCWLLRCLAHSQFVIVSGVNPCADNNGGCDDRAICLLTHDKWTRGVKPDCVCPHMMKQNADGSCVGQFTFLSESIRVFTRLSESIRVFTLLFESIRVFILLFKSIRVFTLLSVSMVVFTLLS